MGVLCVLGDGGGEGGDERECVFCSSVVMPTKINTSGTLNRQSSGPHVLHSSISQADTGFASYK